jgi:hypothetical protein
MRLVVPGRALVCCIENTVSALGDLLCTLCTVDLHIVPNGTSVLLSVVRGVGMQYAA